jgi:NHLM bacteriocin system ABC transporter peptidase/ATP-binding protein
MEAVECGAVSLGIVLGCFGRHPPLEELRAACGVSRDGGKAGDILRAARRYGCVAQGYRMETQNLLAGAFPVIVHWNFNHFLVVEGVAGRKVFLNDPATGPRTVALDEFDAAFTGVALRITPDEGFRRDPPPPSALRRFAPLLGRKGAAFTLTNLLGLSLIVPGVVIPAFTGVFIDEYLIHEKTDWLRPLIVAMILALLINGAMIWLQRMVMLRTRTALALGGSSRFLWRLLHLPVDFFDRRHVGDLVNRISANDKLAAVAVDQIGAAPVNLAAVAVYALTMLMLDPLLTVVCVGLGGVSVIGWKAVSRRREDAARQAAQDAGRFESASVTGMTGIETLKAAAADDDFFARWAGLQANLNESRKRLSLYGVVNAGLEPLIEGLTVAAVLGLGGLRVVDGDMTIGTLVAFQMLIGRFIAPINSLVQAFSMIDEAGADLARVGDVVDHPPAPLFAAPAASPAPLRRLSGALSLRNVTFGYNRHAPPLLTDFSLTATPGARIALVGGSGSGKSTVAKLIAGVQQPWSGEILFDGVPTDRWPRDVLTGSVGVVIQEVGAFAGTVRDNLTLWDATIRDEALTDALRDADLLDAVMARAGGLSAPVGERGGNFSGGQLQRLEIARALAGGPSILVLDEATSAVDPLSEKRIDRALRRRGCTCVIVAHRLSTVRDADEIIVLDGGQVAERGRHGELMRRDGAYRRLMSGE